ncbi:hypothetical protein ACNKHK_28040 [Shigella flexneri]
MIMANISAVRFVEKAKEPALFLFTISRRPKRLTRSVPSWQSWDWSCQVAQT